MKHLGTLAILLGIAFIAWKFKNKQSVLSSEEIVAELRAPKTYQVAAGKVETVTTGEIFEVKLNGKTIHTLSDVTSYPKIEFQGKLKQQDILLVDVYHGNGCPSMGDVITISSDGATKVFDTIGSCAGFKNAEVTSEQITFYFYPDTRIKHSVWVYRDGELTQAQ